MTDLRASPWDIARQRPDHPALIFPDTGETRTYAQMIKNANRFAHRLVADGLEIGDCVAVLLENRVEYIDVVWAAKQLGIYYVCLPSGITRGDAAYILENSGAKVLITSDKLADAAATLLDLVPGVTKGYMMGKPAPGFVAYGDALADMPDTMVPDRPRGLSMLYSSGTTGRPKGVKHQILDVSPHTAPPRHTYLRNLFDFSPDTVFLGPGPFYHTGPLRLMVHAMRDGATVLAFHKFDAEQVLRSIETYSATCGNFVPTMFKRMLDLPEELRNSVDVSTMQTALHGAAPISPVVKDRMIDWWGNCITEMYGGTESIGTTVIHAEDWKKHRGSVGKATSITRVRIEAPDGSDCPPGVPGLILMTQGKEFEYHGDPEKTSEATRGDGWGTMGDIGYMDEEGYLYLTDRQSNLIISGGVNVYPQEAENVLTGHPDVRDVAVFGIPSEDFGEQVHAVVVPQPSRAADEEFRRELIEFCRSEIGKIKSPRSLEYADALPRSETGKILKKQLRQSYWPETA